MTPLQSALNKQNMKTCIKCDDRVKINGASYCKVDGKLLHPMLLEPPFCPCPIEGNVKEQKPQDITLRDFLRTKTDAYELCIIRDEGYIVAAAYIDKEDLFYVPSNLSERTVKKDEWGELEIVASKKLMQKISVHYIDV